MVNLDTTVQLASTADIETVFAPYVVERVSLNHLRYRDALDVQARKLCRVTDVGLGRDAIHDGERHLSDIVSALYTSKWTAVSLANELGSPKTAWFEWRGEAVRARSIGRKHVDQLLLVRVLERLKPHSVLEVGFGYGFNLLLLSMQFPDVAWSGIELTEAGVSAASRLASDAETARLLAPFAFRPLAPCALSALQLEQGSAEALAMRSQSVDVVITVLALEQMERIRHAALAELARVARRYVVMIEPFRDWNRDGLRRRYLDAKRYFAGSIDELAGVGLRLVHATTELPHKIAYRAGLVVAAVNR